MKNLTAYGYKNVVWVFWFRHAFITQCISIIFTRFALESFWIKHIFSSGRVSTVDVFTYHRNISTYDEYVGCTCRIAVEIRGKQYSRLRVWRRRFGEFWEILPLDLNWINHGRLFGYRRVYKHIRQTCMSITLVDVRISRLRTSQTGETREEEGL